MSRDPIGYVDGGNLYGAYYLPGELDPLGTDWLDDYAKWFRGGSTGARFVKGLGSGVIGGALFVGATFTLVAVGVPAAVITTGTMIVGATGGGVVIGDLIVDPSSGNFAENAGMLIGGGLVGGMTAKPLTTRLSPKPPGPPTFAHDAASVFKPRPGIPIGTQIAIVMGKGPTILGEEGAISVGGAATGIVIGDLTLY